MSRGSISLAALLWLVIAFLVLYPLSILVVESFKIAETGGWGIGNYLEFFQDAYYLKTFGNTLLSEYDGARDDHRLRGASGIHFGEIPALG